MNLKKIFINFFLIFTPLLILEIFSSVVIYLKEKKIGILFSMLNMKADYQTNYEINWDKNLNKIVPGRYKTKLKDDLIIEYTINSKGFRDKEFSTSKDSDFRIISFGGSTTMGLESPDDLTYPKQLEKEFKKNKLDVEVLNFGLSSKSLNFISELFFLEGINYKPDFITIYSARNSIMYDSIGTKIKKKKIKFHNLQKINLYLINNFMFYRLISKIYNKIISYTISSEKILSPYDKKVDHNIYYFETQYLETLKQIINFAQIHGIKVVLIKQAIYIDPSIQKIIKTKSLDELLYLLKNIRKEPEYKLSYENIFWILTISILNKQLDKLKNIENVIIVDPRESLIRNKKNFVDYLHLSPQGNKTLASEIYFKIKSYF